MVFLKQLLYHPYIIHVEIRTNSSATPKSLAHAIEIYVSCPMEVVVTPFYVIL